MMVYVVTTGSYSDYSIDSIWSTREKAEEYVKSQTDPEGDGHEIQREQDDFNEIKEMELDAPYEPLTFTTYWKWALDNKGSYTEREEEWYQRARLSDPRHRHKGRGWVDFSMTALQNAEHPGWKDYQAITAYSPISREHAKKMAEEAWQHWLRDKATFETWIMAVDENDNLVSE